MAEDLNIIEGTKEEQYKALLPQIKALIEGEADVTANLANIAAALKEQFKWLWIGFYIIKNNELVVVLSRGRLHVHALKKAKVFVVKAGQKQKQLLLMMLKNFRVILPAAAYQNQRLLFQCLKTII